MAERLFNPDSLVATGLLWQNIFSFLRKLSIINLGREMFRCSRFNTFRKNNDLDDFIFV
jgi:hypothetical protein